jgi:hypothetical protein
MIPAEPHRLRASFAGLHQTATMKKSTQISVASWKSPDRRNFMYGSKEFRMLDFGQVSCFAVGTKLKPLACRATQAKSACDRLLHRML